MTSASAGLLMIDKHRHDKLIIVRLTVAIRVADRKNRSVFFNLTSIIITFSLFIFAIDYEILGIFYRMRGYRKSKPVSSPTSAQLTNFFLS